MPTLINKNIKKNINFLLKKMKNFGLKREKELPGSKNIQKLKTLNTARMMLKLNGIMTEL